MLRIEKDFPGACLGDVAIENDTVYANLGREREEGNLLVDGRRMDYNCAFLFALINDGSKALTAQIFVNCRGVPRSDTAPRLFSCAGVGDSFRPLLVEGACNELTKQYYFTIPLRPFQAIQISNVMYRELADLQTSFARLAANSGAAASNYGISVLGHPLPLYNYQARRKNAPTIFIVTGYHPMEPEWMATESIMAALATRDWQCYRDLFSFCIAPIANPDGYELGYNACNANLVNFYWDFRYQDNQVVPEAYALLALARRIKPIVYFDFHAYTYQQKKYPGPYIKPSIFYQGKRVRCAVRDINKQLIKLCQGHYLYNYSSFTPSTLATILMNEFNTITYSKFHLHQLYPPAANARLAAAAVRTVLDTLIKRRLTKASKILIRQPARSARNNFYRLLFALESKTSVLELVDRFLKVRL